MVLISLSGFKLPHYLNIIFPIASIFTASYLYANADHLKVIRRLSILQSIICVLCIVVAGAINVWAFPVQNLWSIGGFFLFIVAGYILFKMINNKAGKIIMASAYTSLLVFYLLNANFYPQLLQYQAGNEMASVVNNSIGPANVYFQEGERSWSLNFYTRTLHQDFHDSLLTKQKNVWLVTNSERIEDLKKQYVLGKNYQHVDYEITRLQGKFINPATRSKATRNMIIVQVLGKK
jgi:hypothetical protein